MITGIYSISYKDIVYVGSTYDIARRWKEHRADFKHKRSTIHDLQKIYDEYGIDALSFDILETCHEDDLYEREHYHASRLAASANATDTRRERVSYEREHPIELYHPSHGRVTCTNLQRFCAERGLDRRTMQRIIARTSGYRSHHGWCLYRVVRSPLRMYVKRG